MGFSEIFIRRPIATSLVMLGILVFGAATYRLLPVSSLPIVDSPTISVTANLPGASPQTMASAVATPLEQQFASIPGMVSMTSTSGLGSTSITLQFDLNRNVDGAAQDVQTAISAAGGLLPKDLPNPPSYRKVNPADQPVLMYIVYSDTMPLYKLDDYAFTILAQKISSIAGVAQVSVAGQQTYSPHIQIDPDALAAKGIDFETVRAVLTAATLDEPKGTLEGNRQAIGLDTNDQLFDAAAFANTILVYRNGAPVRIKDVGDVIDSSAAPKTGAYYDQRRGELLMIFRQAGANTIQTVDTIKNTIPQLMASVPASVHVKLLSDRSETIRASVNDVQFTLLITIGLVVIVIYLFLGSGWATIIPSVTVPLSLVATFGAMYFLGFSLDNLSLIGLTIAVGFVVDDAIVMIENIVRYIDEGDDPLEAALKGARQIGFTIISITFSLIAVFIPLFFMGGIVGRLFREFAITVSVAVIASAFIALTLTPTMCALFLKQQTHSKKNWVTQRTDAFFSRMLRGYDLGLGWAFRHQATMLTLTLGLIGLTVMLYILIPKGFFPRQDTGFIFGVAEAQQDISYDAMVVIEEKLAAIVRQDPDVSEIVSFAGATFGNPAENTARLNIQLKPLSERSSTSDEFIARMRQKTADIQDAHFFMQTQQDINVGGRQTKTQYQYTLTDTDTAELNYWAPILQKGMQTLTGLQDVASDQQIASPHIAVEIDRDQAYRLGLSLSLIDQTLYDAFGQRQISTIYSSTGQYKVILEVQPRFQADASALGHVYLQSPGGGKIPLSTVAHFSQTLQPLSINHQGLFSSVTLSFNLAPHVALGQAVDAVENIKARLGVPASLQGSFQGTAQAFQASLSSTPLLILAAILVVYIVLGILYESYIHPITILSALPSAGVGALLMLMIFQYELSVIALVGIILLIGIVKKNAIMMIDFALEAERNEGKSPLEAIHEACLLRFRPIMMTTMAALFGGLPLAIGHGAGSELRRPLGIAIVGGLLVSQILTLYTTPVIYLYLDRLSRRFGRTPGKGAKKALVTVASDKAALVE